MPQLRAGEWIYDQGEIAGYAKPAEVKAEDKPGHRPLSSYNLPKWVYTPDAQEKKIIVEKNEYFGCAADGARNFENWNVAHVAAYHDDFKMLSLATIEQCKEPNKFGMTPAHMCGMGQHPYGPSIHVLYELMQMGVVDPEAANHAMQTPWHIAQRMHKPNNVKMFEKVLLKGHKPKDYDSMKAFQLKSRLPAKKSADEAVKKMPELGTIIVFPGQGSQYVGMMKSLKELPVVKTMLAKAKEILGYDLLDVMLNGPEETLSQTKYCQPAMYVAGLAAYEQLKIDEPSKVSGCTAVAGLSLGEYTALTVAGVFDFETGLKLVKERGEAMEFETTRPGAPKQGMLSVAGLEQSVVEKLCKEVAASTGDVCQIANYLFPKGFSVAGTEAAMKELEKKAMDAQALQAKMLKTSGGFHTPLMAGAKDHLMSQLEAVEASMKPPQIPVYMNVTASPIAVGAPVKDIISMLGDQLVSPVKWEQSMAMAVKDGCNDFVECGPSKQLKAMMKRINPKAAEKMINIIA
jgi:[acyl-carrier-protein] S-malonyltransferase